MGVVAGLAAFAFGTAVCLAFGRVGFMPLDQSIVFDGAWRLLSGQAPFRDFTLPNGLTPIVMQAACFRLFGVSWLAYCLHAAVINGLFCALVFVSLRRFGAGVGPAALYGMATGLVMYAPMGTPFMDQHAFFFTAVAVIASVEARRASGRAKGWLWLAVPIAWALAYASKQIPSAFALPVVLAIAASEPAAARRQAALGLGAGAAIAVGLAIAWAAVGRVSPAELAYSMQTLPAQVGAERLHTLASPWRLLKASAYVLGQGWRSAAALLAIGLGGLALPWLVRSGDRRGLGALALAAWALGACLAFSLLTNNQPANGLAYGFWALGLVHGAGSRLVGARAPRVALAAGVAVSLVAAADATAFARRVDVPRLVNELPVMAPATLPAPLAAMVWGLPPLYHYSADDLTRVTRFFAAHPGNFFLLGDTSVLYGITGRPSINPALWFHPGLTMPPLDSPAFARYTDRLRETLARHQVRYVVVEGEGPLAGVRLADLAGAFAPYALSRASATSLGGFTILTLGTPSPRGGRAPQSPPGE